jgi:hypothetical protein
MNTPTPREEFEEWLETFYNNSNILSPRSLAWEAWQAAQKEVTAAREELAELNAEYGTWWAQKRIAIDELKEVTEQRDRLAEVLRNIMAYRKGEKPHDYWRLPFEERENAAFDVWMQIENSINQALKSLN